MAIRFTGGKTPLAAVSPEVTDDPALSEESLLWRFVRQANIDGYRRLLAQTADGPQRQHIQTLLDEVYQSDRLPLQEG
jgi:hypothetical protein